MSDCEELSGGYLEVINNLPLFFTYTINGDLLDLSTCLEGPSFRFVIGLFLILFSKETH